MTLAYLDSFAGLVPCRIVAVGDWSDRYSMARIKLTANRGAYKRGEFMTVILGSIFPRHALVTRNGQYRILAYKWSDAPGTETMPRS